MNLKTTVYGVYIIESLREGDFEDGKNLNKILDLSHIVTIYEKVKSVDHFKTLLKDFKTSKFRYLHISCHANSSSIEIHGEIISNEELQKMLGLINDKRIFMSACQAANRELANLLIAKSGVLSLIGTPLDLNFDKAALFWPSFYHVMKDLDENKMSREHLKKTLQQCVNLFNVAINYYSKIKEVPTYIRRLKIRPEKRLDNRKLIVKFK